MLKLSKDTKIRKVCKGDRPAILAIIEGTGNLTDEEKDCAVELLDIYLENPRQKDYYFLAAADHQDSPVGYVCYGRTPLTDAVYDMYWIVVDEAHRNKGVGKDLLDATEDILRKEGARVLVAETSGLPAYEPARSFYKRNGFGEEAKVKDFYKTGDDLIIYVKRF